MTGTETEGSTTDTQQTMGESAPTRAFVLNTKPLFKLMVEKKASDLFFTSNAPIKIKIEGQIKPINRQVLTADQVRQARLRADEPGAARLLPPGARDRLRGLGAGPGAIPRRRVPPARQPGDGPALHHVRHAQIEDLGCRRSSKTW
jgi:hypothetical protein